MVFQSAWPDRVDVEVDGLSFPTIGMDDLIANKEAVARLRDLDDARLLRRARDTADGGN